MKNEYAEAQLVATFGHAKLFRRPDGWFELRGGLPQDRFEAREWASMFLHEAVLGEIPPQLAAPTARASVAV